MMTNYTKAEQELINATQQYDGESWDTTDPFSNTFDPTCTCFVCNAKQVSPTEGTWLDFPTGAKPICDTCEYIPEKPEHQTCPECGHVRDYDGKEFCSTECAVTFLDIPEPEDIVECDHCGERVLESNATVCEAKEYNMSWHYCLACDLGFTLANKSYTHAQVRKMCDAIRASITIK